MSKELEKLKDRVRQCEYAPKHIYIGMAGGNPAKHCLECGFENPEFNPKDPEQPPEFEIGDLCEFRHDHSSEWEVGYFVEKGEDTFGAACNREEALEGRAEAEYDKCKLLEGPEILRMIPWEGGECPFEPCCGSKVVIKYRGGGIVVGYAEGFSWHHSGRNNDITAYAVLADCWSK